jgi:1-acyl-sn-glycerol-3-phosphate acyltransferase
MKAINAIGVGRQNPREDFQIIMKEGKANLSEGTSIVIFPQSTRTIEFIPENFNSIGVKLAKPAGVKVLPIAVKTDFWGNGKILKDFGSIHREIPVYVNIGEAMEITGNGKAEHKEIVNFIQTNLNNWSTNTEK